MLEVDVALLAIVAGDRGQILMRSWACNQPLGPGLYGAVAGKLIIVTFHPSLKVFFPAIEDGITEVGCVDMSESTEACLSGDSTTDGSHLMMGLFKRVMSRLEELSLSPKTPSSLRGLSTKVAPAHSSSSSMPWESGTAMLSDSYSESESTSSHSSYMTRLLACFEIYVNVG